MVMRYAHLPPAYLSAEVGLLDAPQPKKATKGQRAQTTVRAKARVFDLPKEGGSSGRI